MQGSDEHTPTDMGKKVYAFYKNRCVQLEHQHGTDHLRCFPGNNRIYFKIGEDKVSLRYKRLGIWINTTLTYGVATSHGLIFLRHGDIAWRSNPLTCWFKRHLEGALCIVAALLLSILFATGEPHTKKVTRAKMPSPLPTQPIHLKKPQAAAKSTKKVSASQVEEALDESIRLFVNGDLENAERALLKLRKIHHSPTINHYLAEINYTYCLQFFSQNRIKKAFASCSHALHYSKGHTKTVQLKDRIFALLEDDFREAYILEFTDVARAKAQYLKLIDIFRAAKSDDVARKQAKRIKRRLKKL